MRALLSRLEDNPEGIPSLDGLSKELGMSKSTLAKTFKTSYGINISEYLHQKRMHKAQELIKNGSLTILQVALEVGYQNQSSFGRAFKTFFGHSPLKDRQF